MYLLPDSAADLLTVHSQELAWEHPCPAMLLGQLLKRLCRLVSCTDIVTHTFAHTACNCLAANAELNHPCLQLADKLNKAVEALQREPLPVMVQVSRTAIMHHKDVSQ